MQRYILGIGFCVAVALLASTASSKSTDDLNVTIAKAPVAPDGTAAGALTDFVLTFVDRDPDVDGIALKNGATVEIKLPADFKNTGPGTNNVVLLQGWPQSPQVPFPYTIDIVGNTVTLTLNKDWNPGDVGPGVKQCHLVLLGFRNPTRPGNYDVPLKIETEPGGEVLRGVGRVRIIPKALPSVNVVSLFSGGGPPPPFNNPFYQCIEQGEDALTVGLYLWGRASAALVDVDIEMNKGKGAVRTGRFVDEDGRTVGHVRIRGPKGAADFSVKTAGASVETNAFVTGVPVGLLLTDFCPDPDVPGDYTIEYSLNGGNTETLFITVKDD
jgi:hypothetical protein